MTEFAENLKKEMISAGIQRVTANLCNEKIGYKIREAQLNKIPYMVILGNKELESGKISVRSCVKGDLGLMDKDEFIDMILNDIKNKK